MSALAVMMLAGSAAQADSDIFGNEKAKYKLPTGSRMINLPYLDTPYRLRFVTSCSTTPTDCQVSTTSLFTAWVDIGAPYDWTDWSPLPKDQIATFYQYRYYTQLQERYEQQRQWNSQTGMFTYIGFPIRHEQEVTRTESRPVYVSWSGWANTEDAPVCGAWLPEASTRTYGESFTQTQTCSQAQAQDRIYTAEGEVIAVEPELRYAAYSNTQAAVGGADYIVETLAGEWTEWADVGIPACTDWVVSSESESARECSVGQERHLTYYDHWFSGNITINRTETEEGERNYAERIANTELYPEACGEWSATSTIISQAEWLPLPETQLNLTGYSQSQDVTYQEGRECVQTVFDADGNESQSVRIEYREGEPVAEHRNIEVIPEGESEASYSYSEWNGDLIMPLDEHEAMILQTRTFDSVTSQDYVHWYDYPNDMSAIYTETRYETANGNAESRYVYGTADSWSVISSTPSSGWTPAIAGQEVAFTQSRESYEDLERMVVWQNAEGQQVDSYLQNDAQTATQTRTINVGMSDWALTGTGAGTWTPAISAQVEDFEQTRTTDDTKSRELTYYLDDMTVLLTTTQEQGGSATESRNIAVQSHEYDDTCVGTSAWSPAISEQELDFSQTQDCEFEREIRWNYFENDAETGSLLLQRSEYVSVESTNVRDVVVSVSEGEEDVYVGEWEPSFADAIEIDTWKNGLPQVFSQKTLEIYSLDTTYTYTEADTGAELDSRVETESIITPVSRGIEAYLVSMNEVSRVCGNWSPEASTVSEGEVFTQTRDCDVVNEYGFLFTDQESGEEYGMELVQDSGLAEETQEATGTLVSQGTWETVSGVTHAMQDDFKDGMPAYDPHQDFDEYLDAWFEPSRYVKSNDFYVTTGVLDQTSNGVNRDPLPSYQKEDYVQTSTNFEPLGNYRWTAEYNAVLDEYRNVEVTFEEFIPVGYSSDRVIYVREQPAEDYGTPTCGDYAPSATNRMVNVRTCYQPQRVEWSHFYRDVAPPVLEGGRWTGGLYYHWFEDIEPREYQEEQSIFGGGVTNPGESDF